MSEFEEVIYRLMAVGGFVAYLCTAVVGAVTVAHSMLGGLP